MATETTVMTAAGPAPSTTPRCLECERPMRPADADAGHPRWAGTIRVGARGLCATCYGRSRRPDVEPAVDERSVTSKVVRIWPATWTPLDELTRDEATDALCAQTDPEIFFPEKGGSPRAAKRVCMRCPIRSRCLEVAIANPKLTGVWGATTDRERHAIRETTQAAAA